MISAILAREVDNTGSELTDQTFIQVHHLSRLGVASAGADIKRVGLKLVVMCSAVEPLYSRWAKSNDFISALGSEVPQADYIQEYRIQRCPHFRERSPLYYACIIYCR